MATTLSDYGRTSERYGEIPYHNVYKVRFYLLEDKVAPDDVHTWCKENCTGYYRIESYLHKDSTPGSMLRYADKVYLQEEKDAMLIKLRFEVLTTSIKRPKMPPKKKAK